jgi:hypothetical protein
LVTGGVDAEEDSGPPEELEGGSPFPGGGVPGDPELVVVGLVVVLDVVVVDVVVVSVVEVVVVVSTASQWSSFPLALP